MDGMPVVPHWNVGDLRTDFSATTVQHLAKSYLQAHISRRCARVGSEDDVWAEDAASIIHSFHTVRIQRVRHQVCVYVMSSWRHTAQHVKHRETMLQTLRLLPGRNTMCTASVCDYVMSICRHAMQHVKDGPNTATSVIYFPQDTWQQEHCAQEPTTNRTNLQIPHNAKNKTKRLFG